MHNISSLPKTDKVKAMPIRDLAAAVSELAHPSANICGEAAMDVNRFLAEAAVRMAAHLLSEDETRAAA